MSSPTRVRTSAEAPVLLASGIGVALAALAIGGVLLAIGYDEDAESTLYLSIFAIGLPLSVAGALWRAPAGRGGARWALLALAAVLIGARLCVSFGAPRASAAVLVAGSVVWLGWALGGRLPSTTPPWPLPAAAALALAVCLIPGGMLRPGPLAVALLLTAALLGLEALLERRGSLPAGWVVDVAVVLLAAGLAVDFTSALQPAEFVRSIANIHHDFYLGPANDVLNGRPVLDGTVSQYGVLPIYLVAATHAVVPLGYDSLEVTAGLLSAGCYASLYALLRLGRTPRLLAATATVATVLTAGFGGPPFRHSVLTTFYPGTGGLRFLPVWLALLLGVLAVDGRRPRLVRPALALAVVASALWSLEVFLYAVCILAAVAAAAVASAAQPREELRRCVRAALALAGLCVVAHVAFAVITRVWGGDWPDWGAYLAFVRFYASTNEFSVQVSSWSPLLAMGGAAFASLATLAVLSLRDRRLLEEERVPVVAIAGSATFTAVALSYYVGESITYDLQAIAPPAIALVFLWAALIARRRGAAPARVVPLAVAFGLAALLAVGGWGNMSGRFDTTALGLSVPGIGDNGNLIDRIEHLGHGPPLDPREPAAEQLLAKDAPGHGPVAMLADSELTVETLVRAQRANQLEIAHPLQDELLLKRTLARVDAALADMKPNTPLLIQSDRLPAGAPLRPIDRAVLERIRRRFQLVPIESVPQGLTMVRLVPR